MPVCQACLQQLHSLPGERCAVCGEDVGRFDAPATGEARLCGLCQRARPPFERAVAFGSYDGALRELLHLLKYAGVRPAAPLLSGLLVPAVRELKLEKAVVVPVPLHPARRRQRGYNQSELIARSLARAMDMRMEARTLARTRPTESQTGLTRHQRRANLRGAFAVRHVERLRGRAVLLVDDVMTTGTTAAECARVLLRAGARRVYVATAARVLRHELAAEIGGPGAPAAAQDF